MTPRPVVFSVSEEMPVQEFFLLHSKEPFSRIPLYAANADDITGYVLKSDLLVAQAKDQFDKTLSEFKRDFLMLPDSVSASDAFDRLMHEKSHIALVIDEYGTMQGLVTQEDIMETLIGLEITDELDKVEDMRVLAYQRWRERMVAIGIDPDSIESKQL
jgi:CBS domain containing-hemolysin-like protein